MSDISVDALVADITAWASIESPTDQPERVNRMMSHVEELHRSLGMQVERVPGTGGRGDKVVARAPWGDSTRGGILSISHLDTVHPVGTLERLPVRRIGDRLQGPGVYDMKGGGCMALEAARSILRAQEKPNLPLTFLYIPDEEMGSQTSREIIAQYGRTADYVFVPEGANAGGAVVTSRKGSVKFDLVIEGRPAHSGSNHREGRSALRELAHQILTLEAMTDYARDVTVNVGIAAGGTRANVIPERATARVDVRVPTPEIATEMLERISAMRAHDPDVTVRYTGQIWRRPYERSDRIGAFYDTARGVARDIGFDLKEALGRGGSDANLVAEYTPVLDGLGPDGGGAHTLEEWIDLTTLRQRTELMRRLMLTLQ